MDLKAALARITANKNLSSSEMEDVIRLIMAGKATQAQIGGFLIALHMKGETVEEIAAAANVIRDLATPVSVKGPYLVDIVGTGGDQSHTFNISTASAFVAAAAGAKVAKHNNRAISSQSGSADLLEIAGINPVLEPNQIAQCIEKIGIGFMFAPRHHSSWRHTVGPRKELGVRTLFNILGPMVNPAKVPNQVVGVFSQQWVQPMAAAFKQLGSEHILVVHSEDGLDEISVSAPTFVAELNHGRVSTYTITPEQFKFTTAPLETIQVASAQESYAVIKKVFANQAGPARDIVALNAGAAIYAAGLSSDLASGIEKALTAIANDGAQKKIEALAKMSQQFAVSQ